MSVYISFFFNDTATTEIYTLSLTTLFRSFWPTRHSRASRRATCGYSFLDRRRCCRRRSPNSRRSEEHTSELQSRRDLVCRLLLEKKKNTLIPLTTRLDLSHILHTIPTPPH